MGKLSWPCRRASACLPACLPGRLRFWRMGQMDPLSLVDAEIDSESRNFDLNRSTWNPQ